MADQEEQLTPEEKLLKVIQEGDEEQAQGEVEAAVAHYQRVYGGLRASASKAESTIMIMMSGDMRRPVLYSAKVQWL